MKASDVMVSKVITTHPQASISEAVKLLIDNDVSALPVVDEEGGRVVGVISEADIMRRAEDRNGQAPSVVARSGDPRR